MLEKLKNLGSARGVVPGFLRPIDTEVVARQLGLSRLGAENGSKNLPPSDAKALDDVEQAVVQKLQAEWAWQGDELLNQLRTYAQRLVQHSIVTEFEKLQLEGKNALARLRTAHHRAEAELGPLREAFRAYRDDLGAFRERHRLKRAVRDPSNRWATFGLVFLMIGLESILNGFIFAKGSSFGLIGGIGTAIGISIFNVAFAFILGWGPARWMSYRGLFRRSLGALILAAGISGLLALHAFASHLRDATAHLASTNPLTADQEAMQLAVEALIRSPWSVSDLSSAYLFGLGVLFGGLALWKGYTFDDPYPGYGPHYRRCTRARDDYSEEHSALFDSLQDIKNDTIEAVRAGIDEIPRLPQQAASIRAHRATMMEQFRAYEAEVETAINQLLAQYRACNRASRTSAPPAYFDEKWSLPYRFVESAQAKNLLAEPELPRVDVQVAMQELRTLSEALLSEYDSLMRDYPHPTQME